MTEQIALHHRGLSALSPHRALIALVVVVLLTAHAGLRGDTNDRDAAAYYAWYAELQNLDWMQFLDRIQNWGVFYSDGINQFESGFAALGWLSASLGFTTAGFLIICAALSTAVKVAWIFRCFRNPFAVIIALIWFVCWQYLLMEMNAVRIGLALAVVLLGFRDIALGRTRALIFIVAAVFFHVTAILCIVILLFVRFPLQYRSIYLYLLAVAIAVGYLPMHELIFSQLGSIDKIRIYYEGVVSGNYLAELNRFNVLILVKISIFFVAFVVHDSQRYDPVWRIGFFGLWLSLFCYFFLSSIPVLAGRTLELYGLFSVFLIGGFLRCISPSLVVGLFLVGVSALQFFAIVYYSKVVNFFYFLDLPQLGIDVVHVVAETGP